jgi:PAT family beta-lactamase induction signal transducer AmpG
VGAVALQSFASGLPLGLIWIAVPAWLKYQGFDIRTIGLFSLVQAPWNFKFLWAPLMDRYSPGLSLGRKRAWMVLTEILLMLGIFALARQARHPDLSALFVLGAVLALAGASQDIVIDGYAVEVLEPKEFGAAVGARAALYRVAMYLSGGGAIWAGERFGWPLTYTVIGALFLPMIWVVVRSPEPERPVAPPRTLRAAVFQPMLELFKKHQAIEVLLFIVLYKLGENMATTLIRPFLIEKGFSAADVGIAVTTIAAVTTVLGTILGAILSNSVGMARTLWISGVLQAVGCLGYALVDRVGGPTGPSLFDPHRLVMYGAIGAEAIFYGLAAGALGVLMLRITSKEFSATQFALLSSLMGVPRVIVGPFAGVLVDAMGWTPFFFLTVPLAIPGLVMLSRFAPPGAREVTQLPEGEHKGPLLPVTPRHLATVFAVAFAVALGLGTGWSALIDGVKAARPEIKAAASLGEKLLAAGHHFVVRFDRLWSPHDVAGWLALLGPFIFALLVALAAVAVVVARRGVRRA